jgi:predicted component of type VI protein secretion system
MSLQPLLFVEEGPDKGRQFSTEGVQFRIGRGEKCDFILSEEDSAISREHFAIVRRGDAFLFINLSRNGSSINGVKAEQTLLKDNDLVKVGLQTVIRFSLQERPDLEVNPNIG